MLTLRSHFATLLLGIATSSALAQQLPIPQLKSAFPSGARQGATVEVEISGGNLDGTSKLYFSNPGITATPIVDPKIKEIRFKITVAKDMPVGDYDVRSVGRFVISNPRTFSVSDYSETNETEPNDSRDKANRVPIAIGHGVKWGTLVVNAAPDAPIGEGESEIVGTAMRGEGKPVRKARGGVVVWDTVNTPAICRLTHSIVTAVREKTPFAVTASPNELTIKQGDPIKVTVEPKAAKVTSTKP